MTRHIGRNGIQRGGGIRAIAPTSALAPPSQFSAEITPSWDKERAKRIARNVAIGLASVAAIGGIAYGAHSIYNRYQHPKYIDFSDIEMRDLKGVNSKYPEIPIGKIDNPLGEVSILSGLGQRDVTEKDMRSLLDMIASRKRVDTYIGEFDDENVKKLETLLQNAEKKLLEEGHTSGNIDILKRILSSEEIYRAKD